MTEQERALLRQLNGELAAHDGLWRDPATAIAVKAAAGKLDASELYQGHENADHVPSYYAEPFVPHPWVVDAVQAGYKAGLAAAREQVEEYIAEFETRAKRKGGRK